jgi:hypothetical protein
MYVIDKSQRVKNLKVKTGQRSSSQRRPEGRRNQRFSIIHKTIPSPSQAASVRLAKGEVIITDKKA